MTARIEVTFLKKNDNENTNVVATFGIHIKSIDLYMSKCKLIKKNNGGMYVAPPSEEYKDSEGKTKWSNFWWFGEKTSSYFQSEVKKGLEEYCETQKIPSFFK